MIPDNKPFVLALQKAVAGTVLADDFSLGMYSTDASVYQIRPLAVVLPLDESDVLAAVRIAGQYGVSILPRGGGTSLAGQTVGRSMVIDFSKHMNMILELNEKERWVRVQPGVVHEVLNDRLKTSRLHFAPDPATSSRANIGGMVGNNSAGTKSILYGKTVDHVLEARVLLADGNIFHFKKMSGDEYARRSAGNGREAALYRGFEALIRENREEIARRFPKVMRRVGGYNLDEFIHTGGWNLSKLITGSEGTLAVTLEVKLNLEPLPAFKSVCVVHFSELQEAIRAVESILAYNPAAVEILDKTVIDLSRVNLTTRRSCQFIQGDPAAILIVEFYDDLEEGVRDRPEAMIRKFKERKTGYAWPLFPEGPAYNDVWTIRKKGLGLMLGLKGNKKPLAFIEDAGIPTDKLADYIDEVLKVCRDNGTHAAMYAHASVGVIHVRPILDLRDAADIRRFEKISRETFSLVRKYKGSWSGEHGDGLVRSPYNKEFFGPRLYAAFRELKQLFDPRGIMNPGKIVEAPPITENLRYGELYKDRPVITSFHFRADNSFMDAVHMCTGVGECRKALGGTMCPSFKATRDEEHSTRGRANALRLAMSGQLIGDGLAGDRLHQVMDLCLSCKACKSECPSNVDMARLKGEVSQMYFDRKGTTFRDRLIGDSASMAARMSGPLAPVINTIQRNPVFRGILQKVAGIDKRRILPEYAKQSFRDWFRHHVKPGTGKQVALFVDTYMNYHEPRVGIAACNLLMSCGYSVILADTGCCQRPRISHGFLREAAKEGLQTARGLQKFFREEIPVVVCEPSCASALTDDLPDLIDENELADNLADNVMMIDQFIQREVTGRHQEVAFRSVADDVVIHGHCHQKALYGTDSMKEVLRTIPGMSCHELDSGCCGMAGSFGYEKEHYDLSNKIGSGRLFPAINDLGPDTAVIACGFSCRHQIRHFTGRTARHWVELIDVGGKEAT